MIGTFLCACASFSWIVHTNVASLFLLGEYPYPSEEQDA